MIGNFTEVKPLRYWVQHILPLVYDDSLSYMELLSKVINTLNEVVKNNNLLPDYIMELIKEYISSGEIEKVLAEVLANYMLNVKFPPAGLTPATGDGSADDTEAIQGCIDYAYNNGGMSVYFPSGSYLTQPLTLRDKATLFGQDRYTTRLVMKGGATTAMFTGAVDELTLTGLGFDGNMDIQVNNVNLFTVSVNSAIITNCMLTDGYDLLNITVNDNLQLNDVIFKHAVENALVLKGAGIVQGNNLIFKSVSALVGKNFVVMDVSKSILDQLKCYGASPNAVLINGSNNVVKMWNEQSLKAYTDNGVNNTVEVYTQSIQEKLTGFKTTNIDGDLAETVGGNATETITGNKGVSAHDITETATGARTENTTGNRNETTGGNVTKTITGSSNESVTGDKEVNTRNYDETVRGNKTITANKSTENVTTEKELNANVSRETLETKTVNVSGVNSESSGSKNEIITGDKTVKAANCIETIDGDKTINAGDISNTAENITNHATQDLTEQVDGVRALTVTEANNETTGARTETVNGNKTEHITGTSNETVDGNKITNVVGTNEFKGDKIKFSTAKPLGYVVPTNGNTFDTIPLTNPNDEQYNVLVENDNTYKLNDATVSNYDTLYEKLMNGGTVIQIGDSLGEGLGWWNYDGTPAKSEENDGMFAVLRKQFPKTKWANYAVSGATFIQQENDLDHQIDNITETSADLLVVIAGINDINYLINQGNVNLYGKISPSWAGEPTDLDRSTFLGAIDYTMNKLQKKFPNTPVIYILTSTAGKENDGPTNANYWTLKNLIKISMHRWNCRIFDCRKYLNYCYYPYTQDFFWQNSRLHYSEAGYKFLANYFSKFIIGSGSDYNFDYEWILPVYGNSTDEIITNVQNFNSEVFNGAFTIRNPAGILLPAMISSYSGATAGFVYNPLNDDFSFFKNIDGTPRTYRPPYVNVNNNAVTSITENMPFNGLYIFSNLSAVTENIPATLKEANNAFVINFRYGNDYHGYITSSDGKRLYVYHGQVNNLLFRNIDLNLGGDADSYIVQQVNGNFTFIRGENTITPTINSGYRIISANIKVNSQLAANVIGFTENSVNVYSPTAGASDYTLSLTLIPKKV